MNDFNVYEKNIVRELSCRLCLCTDVVKLKPLSNELKRKLRKLFNINVRVDDNLPKAICHDCLQQIGSIHRYSVKVEKTQNFLEFYTNKSNDKSEPIPAAYAIVTDSSLDKLDSQDVPTADTKLEIATTSEGNLPKRSSQETESKAASRFRVKSKTKLNRTKRKSPGDLKHREAMPLEEFIKTEGIDHGLLLDSRISGKPSYWGSGVVKPKPQKLADDLSNEVIDPIILKDGKPAQQGTALDKQISLFYKMKCNICHETGFQYKSLMKHYKDKHGVPGYVTCCDKKFHYFYPRKIVEHMAYHLQPNIFMCPSCHENFQSSQELVEHQTHGGRTDGKILCPHCNERFPTWRELGCHLLRHRTDKPQCDYCGKCLKHHHRKKTINSMEDVVLCSHCTKALKSIERQAKAEPGKDIKDLIPRIQPSFNPLVANQPKYKRLRRTSLPQSEGDTLQE